MAAQGPARILGRVVDVVTRRPLAGAEIRVGELVASSADDGGSSSATCRRGESSSGCGASGTPRRAQALDLLPGLDRSVSLALEPLPVRLDSLTATAAPGASRIAGIELERRGGDLARALDGWEGVVVRRSGTGPAAPQVRGSGPDEVLVLVDGFPVNDPLTGRAGPEPHLEPRGRGRHACFPGAQTVRAGNRAIGGVLLVETRRDVRPEGSTWSGSHGALGLRLGGSAGPLTASASAERQAGRLSLYGARGPGGGEGRPPQRGRRRSGRAALTLDGPVEVVLAAARRSRPSRHDHQSDAGGACRGSLGAAGRARPAGRLSSAASLQWLEARATRPRHPPPGPATTPTPTASARQRRSAIGCRCRWRAGAAAPPLGAEGRGNRFAGDASADGASFSQAALKVDGRFAPGTASAWSVAPAVRLDVWTGSTTPRLSARVDAGWQRGRTALTLAAGSAVTPPVLADLFFREGVGVRLNPDLRPERVRWELDAGLRQELGAGATIGVRGFVGQVGDMIIWAPDFRFIWSPRNFDVLRRGAEISVGWRARPNLRAGGSATYSAVTYDTPGGAQVLYRPRVTYDASVVWSPGPWTADLRWHRIGRRFPNSAGTNPRPAFSLLDLGLERRLGAGLGLRGEIRDLTDRRAEFLAGYPTPGRSVLLTFTLVAP